MGMKAWNLDAEGYDRVYSNRELFRRIFGRFLPHKKTMIIVVTFLVLASLSAGLLPLFTRFVVNETTKIDSDQNLLIGLISVIISMNLVGFIFSYIHRSNMNRMVYRVCFHMRRDSNYQVLMQDLSFFDKFPTGKIVSRINSDGQKFGEAANLFLQAIASVLILLIVIIPMFIINSFVAAVLMLLIPIMFIFTFTFRKMSRKRSIEGQRSLSVVNAFVQESLSGIQIAKTFRQEKKLFSEFEFVNKQSYVVNMKRALFMNILWPSLDIIVGIIFAFLIYFGGNQVLLNELTSADLYLFFQSSAIIFQPLFQLVSFWPQFQDGLAAAERMFSLVDSESTIKEGTAKLKVNGEIEFKNLNFEYAPGKKVFNDFSLKIQPGESVAIVGHTGAGKTSLARLLLRLYEFQSGDDSLKIDGKSIRELDLNHFRKQIGYIPQVPFLWDDSIEANVKYSRPEATVDEIKWALQQAGGFSWVANLDNGLQTQIMERGKLLSMGQRQLVAFARVLLQDPSILILDEATASVDPFTETQIQEAMEKAMESRTTIIIAHRLVTVRHVNRIIVLDHGKLIEEGNHEQLMEKGGYYSELYNTYFRHQSYEFLEEISAEREKNQPEPTAN